MWILTDVADWFDKARRDDDRFLDDAFQGWVDYAVKHEDDPVWYSSLRNAAIYTGTWLSLFAWKGSTLIASGFVDTLRIGDGVKEGGWGYAEDALRLLTLSGPVLKVAGGETKVIGKTVQYAGEVAPVVKPPGLTRVFSSDFVGAADIAPTQGICTWVAATKALRMTGTRHFATVRGLMRFYPRYVRAFSPDLPDISVGELRIALQQLGVRYRAISPINPFGGIEETLAVTVARNPNSVAVFNVWWEWAAGMGAVGNEFRGLKIGDIAAHSMVALRDPATGALRILDRSGRLVGSLAELDDLYPGIKYAKYIPENPDPSRLVRTTPSGKRVIVDGSPPFSTHETLIFDKTPSAIAAAQRGVGIEQIGAAVEQGAAVAGVESPLIRSISIILIDNASVTNTFEDERPIGESKLTSASFLRQKGGTFVIKSDWLLDAIGLEIRSIPFRVEKRRTISVPLRPNAAGKITQKVCVSARGGNSTCSYYETARGDTLKSIAKAVYNDVNKWRLIYAFNMTGIGPDYDPDNMKIEPGVLLLLPNTDGIIQPDPYPYKMD